MFGIVIDKDRYKVAFVVLNEDKSPLYYELQEDEAIIETEWNVANAMNKPQWTGEEWIDTDPIIEEPFVPQPTEIEILQEQLMESYLAQAELYEITLTQDEQILNSYDAQAELFEVILTQEETINELKNRLDALEGIAQPLI